MQDCKLQFSVLFMQMQFSTYPARASGRAGGQVVGSGVRWQVGRAGGQAVWGGGWMGGPGVAGDQAVWVDCGRWDRVDRAI